MLDRLLIKNYNDTNDSKVRASYGILASCLGIVWNVLLSIAKIVVGAIFQSVSILADGLNNLSDAGSSIVTILGFRIANRPADKNHPFGHARFEYIASMIISFIVLFIGLELVISSIEKLVNGMPTEANYIVMAVLAVSIIVKLGMFFYYRSVAKKIDSSTIKAMSIDSINDVVASLAVLISTIVIYYTHVNIDGYMGIVVAIYIFISGVMLFKDTISPILGEKPSRELVSSISDRVHSYNGVLGIHDLMVHNYGPNNIHASLHVEVDARHDLMQSHDLIDTIERDFRADGIDMVIHLDPVVTDDERVDEMKELVMGELIKIDPRISIHDFRAVFGEGRKKLIFDIAVPSDMVLSDDRIVELLIEKVQSIDKTCTLIIDVDRNYIGIQ